MHYFCKCIFFLASFNLLVPAFAKVIYVDDDATSGGDGVSWATAHKYLQDGLAVAEYGDEIWVAEGTYKPDQGAGKTAGDRASPFVLVNGVGMYGGFLGTETTRDPQGDNQTILSGEINEDSELWSLNVVRGANLDANTTLDGFSITKGNANGFGSGPTYGGGLFVKDSNMTFADLVIIKNAANSSGGGILITGNIYLNGYQNTSIFTNCVFTNNSARNGGGISPQAFQSLIFTNCVFKNNSADEGGGGIHNAFSFLNLTNCVFTNNSAGEGGGGILCYQDREASSLNLTNCVFTNNSAGESGGGISYAGKLSRSHEETKSLITNSIFTNNSADRGGGLCFESFSSLILTNCVFTNNSAGAAGGGILNFSSLYKPASLISCILWNNKTGRQPTWAAINHGLEGFPFHWKSIFLQEPVEALYPGDPNARDAVLEPNLNIFQGWEGDARAFDVDPLFVDIDNPIGPDGIWFTEDDGLRVKSSSSAINSGYNDSLPRDSNDLDKDGNTTEPIPYDASGRPRRVGTKVDIGVYVQ